jgi:hypothetical protein
MTNLNEVVFWKLTLNNFDEFKLLSVQYNSLFLESDGNLTILPKNVVDLGGLVVSVLATGPKVRGFDPDRRWILRVIKIRSTTSFGGEVMPSVPCKRHVKEPYGMNGTSSACKQN